MVLEKGENLRKRNSRDEAYMKEISTRKMADEGLGIASMLKD